MTRIDSGNVATQVRQRSRGPRASRRAYIPRMLYTAASACALLCAAQAYAGTGTTAIPGLAGIPDNSSATADTSTVATSATVDTSDMVVNAKGPKLPPGNRRPGNPPVNPLPKNPPKRPSPVSAPLCNHAAMIQGTELNRAWCKFKLWADNDEFNVIYGTNSSCPKSDSEQAKKKQSSTYCDETYYKAACDAWNRGAKRSLKAAKKTYSDWKKGEGCGSVPGQS